MLSSPCTIMLPNAFNLLFFTFFFYELSDDKDEAREILEKNSLLMNTCFPLEIYSSRLEDIRDGRALIIASHGSRCMK